MNRHLTFPNLLNVRDLGGCATRDASETRWKSILRADELRRLTPEGAQALYDYGVRTIIDLRWPDEAQGSPSRFQSEPGQARYLNISLLGNSEERWRESVPRVEKETWNCIVLDYAQPEIRTVMQAIADATEGGIVFHCLSGKDRTGVVAALLLAIADVEPDIIAEDYAITSENLREPYLITYPDRGRDAILEQVRCPPATVYNMLAHLEEHHQGALAYLRHIGLTENEIQCLRARLREDAN